MPTALPNPEVQPQRAADIISREIPPKEALDFVGGCDVLARVINKEHPDIVLFPQRGAGPIEWTTGAILETEFGDKPHFVDLPLGSHIKINDDEPGLSGISGSHKRELIDETLERLQEAGIYEPGKTRLMLVDEVQKGGTISQASLYLREAMTKRGDTNVLNVVAAQDSRHGLLGEGRTEPYRRLAANEHSGFKTTVIPTSLFMVDRTAFLDEIWKTSSGTSPSLDDYITNPNPRARSLFDALAQVYLDPERALDEIAELRGHSLAPDLGGTILQAEILEAVTDPSPVRGNKSTNERNLIGWWEHFARISMKRSISS